MRFRNSIHLLIDNFGIVYKMLLYKLVVGLISLGLTFVFVIPNLSFFFSSTELSRIVLLVQDFFDALFSGGVEYLAGFRELFTAAVGDLMILVTGKISNIVWTIVGVLLSYILFRFLDTLGNFAFAHMLNEKMNSYAEGAFFDCFIRSIAKGSAYSAVYVAISFVYDMVVGLAVYSIFFMLLSSMPLFISLFGAATVLFAMEALKLTLFSNWIPAIIEGNLKTWDALSYGFRTKVKYRLHIFSTYLISLYLIVTLNVVFGIFSLMSALLLTVPASFLFLLCLQFVNYYTIEGKKYFVNYYKIADNKDKGQKSRFLDESDIKEEHF